VHVAAVAVRGTVVLSLVRLSLVEFRVIPVMQPAVTVTNCVPEMAVFCVEVAVMVDVPTASAFTIPPAVIEAIVVGYSPLQLTAGVSELPWLSIPVAYICT